MPTDFQKAKRRVKLANGNWSKPISYLTSSESVEMTDGSNLQTTINNKVDKVTGKDLSTNDYTDADKIAVSSLGTASTKDVGTANGVAELDSSGKVPSAQLPSYIDDVIEGYYDSSTDRFYKESTFETVIPPEDGKSWVDIPSNKSYRWTGSVYVRVDEGVQLGETSSTAYRGDRGKTAYDHSQTTGNPHGTTKSDVGLGNVDNTSDVNKPISTATQTALNSITSTLNYKVGKGAILSVATNLNNEITTGFYELSATNGHTNTPPGSTSSLYNANLTIIQPGINLLEQIYVEEITGYTWRRLCEKPRGSSATWHDWERVDVSNSKTATGNSLTIESSESNLVECKAEIEAVQEGSGDPSPTNIRPIIGQTEVVIDDVGKNLLPLTVEGIKAANSGATWTGNSCIINNVTFTILTDKNGLVTGIKVNGTASAATYFCYSKNNIAKGQYYFTTGLNGAYNTFYSYITNSDGSLVKVRTDDQSTYPNGLFTLSADETNVQAILAINSGYSASNITLTPMLRLSTETDSTYEPYKGKTYRVEIGQKNKWNEEYTGITSTATYVPIYVGSGSFTLSTTTPLYQTAACLFFLAGNVSTGASTSTNGVSSGVPRTVDSVNGYVTVGYRTQGTTSPVNYETQLEQGSQATPYVPYNPNLPDAIYGGELDVITGELTVTHGEVDLGSLTWNYDGNMFYSVTGLPTKQYSAIEEQNIISSLYKGYSWVDFQGVTAGMSFQNASATLRIKDSRYTSASDFKTAVTGQTLVYELATPYTIQLTSQQIKLLKGTNNLSCNTGDLSIKYYPDNVLGQLKGDIESEYDERVETLESQTQELLPSLTFMSRERRNITSDLGRLSTAVAEQNLAKYGYKIGDYFTGASGYTYILADYNTFKGTSTPYCITSNHLGIVVDTHKTSQWHSGDASDVGYNGSVLNNFLKGTVLDNIKADFKALFGGSTGLEHLIAHSKLYTTALANWAWQANQYISALTCTQIDAGSQWTANGFQEGEASKSLELFRNYKWTEIFGSEYPWLRNLSNYNGGLYACRADGSGVLAGYGSVPNSYFVVGLINFY